MNKSELVDAVAEAADVSKAKALKVVDVFIDTVKATLSARENVALVGFGTFSTAHRKERIGRNPRTGEALKIAAANKVKFTAGKKFKDAVQLYEHPGQKPKPSK
ncbi:HU family DNA-binding protein [Pseudomonas sp. NPDC090592]|uniref:HU family DNA-binding protein n=1 Tax=Pseudomonas sp. NPDC090592 TaxID=3364480 RepID=UPI00383A92C9